MRAELAGLRAAIDRIEAELARFEEEEPRRPPARARPDRYFQVLVAVYEHGVHGVSSDELAKVGRRFGYDRRGLGGYFAGRRAPLRLDGGRVVLTTEGDRLLQDYLERAAP